MYLRKNKVTIFDYKATSWQKYTLPSVDAFKVSDFTGAGTYSYDFWVPPAPAGLAPNLQLSYNSQIIDEALSAYTQGSWVGLGWSLDTGAITRNMHGTDNTTGTNMSSPEGDDTFSISVGGISGTLLPVGSNFAEGTTTYNTADQSFAKVIWNNGNAWTVYTKEGLIYTFGGQWLNDGSHETDHYYASTNKSSGCSATRDLLWRWSLRSVKDTHGNEITYGYYTEKKSGCANQIAVYPDWIEYPNHLYRIQFYREARFDYQHSWTSPNNRVLYGTSRLHEIKILTRASLTDNTWPTVVRRYAFSYDPPDTSFKTIYPTLQWDPDGNRGRKTSTLFQVQEFGLNDTPQKPVQFNYEDNLHLTKVNNSQGGIVTMEYERFTFFDDVGDNERSYVALLGDTSQECYYWRSSNTGSVGCSNNSNNTGVLEIRPPSNPGSTAAVRMAMPEATGSGYWFSASPEQVNKPGNRIRLVYQAKALPGEGQTDIRIGLWDTSTDPDRNTYAKNSDNSIYQTTIGETYSTAEKSLDYPIDFDAYFTGPFIECSKNCRVNNFQLALHRSYYRVKVKTIQDLARNKSTTVNYDYDNPSPNTTYTSEAVSLTTGGVDNNYTCPASANNMLYTCQMAEFRGHSMTQSVQDVVDENNVEHELATINWYYQTDALKGRSYRTLTMQQDLYDNWSGGLTNWIISDGIGLTSNSILGRDFDSNLLLSFPDTIDTEGAKIKQTDSVLDGESVIAQIRLDASLPNLTGNPDPTSEPIAKAVLQVSDTEYFGVQLDKSTNKASLIVNGIPTQDLITGIQTDQWYVVMLIADTTHGHLVRIWQLNKPENTGEGFVNLSLSGPLNFSARVDNGSLWMSAYTEGTIYQENSTLFGSQIIYLQGAGNADAIPTNPLSVQALANTDLQNFKDLGITWSFPTSTETRNYDGHANWVGSKVLIEYQASEQGNLQFGNPTRKTYQEWAWDTTEQKYKYTNHHATKTEYWPGKKYISTSPISNFIASLPGREIALDCDSTCDFSSSESGLLAETLYFYDQQTSYATAPIKGDLTTRLVRAEKEGEAAKYIQSSFTYTANGNPEQTIAFKSYATTTTPLSTSDAALAGGGVIVTKKFYDPEIDPITGLPDPAYNTFVTRETVYTLYSSNDAIAQGQTTYTSYDYKLGLPLKVADVNGSKWGQAYDGLGRTTAVCAPGDWNGITCAPGNGTSTLDIAYFDYASASNPFHIQLTQKQDSQRNIRIIRYYSGIGLLLQEQTLGVDVSGMTGVQNLVTDYEYDPIGRLIHQTKPYPYTGNYSFKAHTDQTFASPNSVVTTTYDILSRVRTVTAPNGIIEQDITYDQLTTIKKDGNTNPTKTTKDIWGNIVALDGPTTTLDEETGLSLSTPVPAAPGLVYEYDKLGNLRFAKVGSGTTQYTTEIQYDKASRKVWMSDPDLGIWSYDYDGAGNLACQKDAKNNSIKLVYDKLNRLAGKDNLGAATCTPETTEITNFTGYDIQFHYDGEPFTYLNTPYSGETGVLGMRTGMVDPSGITQWSYDWRGRKTHESRTVIDQVDNNRNLGTYHTYWSYNPDDSVRQIVYPNQETVNYTYHPGGAFDQAFSVQDGTENSKYYVQATGYDVDGRVVTRTLGENLLNSSYTYTPWNQAVQGGRLGRLLTQKIGSSNVFQDLNYTYDPVGNIIGIQNNANAAFSYNLAFQYDKLNRLDLASGAYDDNPVYSLATGNLIKHNLSGANYTYTTPQDQTHPHAARTSPQGQYSYDPNGNMVTRVVGGTTYQLDYDHEQRLVNISDVTQGTPGSPVARYVYDGDGQRVISIVGTTRTVYIGNVFEAEIGQNDTPSNDPIGTDYCDFHCPNQVFLPVVMGDQNGTMPITSGPTYHSHPAKPTGGITWRTYYYAAGQRIATRETTNAVIRAPYYLLSDHLGSTTVTVDNNGVRTSEQFYKAWGEVDTNRVFGNTPTKRGYTGQYQAEIGLMFYQARFYDPSLGRFVSADTVTPGMENLFAWDRYIYANNAPINFNDPSGHCPLCLTAVIGGAVGAIVGAVGYTAYSAISGQQFNTGHMLLAAGGGAVAGALIGTGVGWAAGVGAAEATTIAVTGGAVAEGANAACGGDMCASETQDVSQILNKTLPAIQDTLPKVEKTLEQVVNVTDKARGAEKFLTDATKFIGSNYQKIASGIYRAENGLRQVRFTDRDLLPTHGIIGSHGHFELLNELGDVIKNIHIPIIGN